LERTVFGPAASASTCGATWRQRVSAFSRDDRPAFREFGGARRAVLLGDLREVVRDCRRKTFSNSATAGSTSRRQR